MAQDRDWCLVPSIVSEVEREEGVCKLHSLLLRPDRSDEGG